MSNAKPVSAVYPQPSPALSFLAWAVQAVCIALAVWCVYAIYSYFWLDAAHPFGAIAGFLGKSQHEFLKVSEYSAFEFLKSGMSALSALAFYVLLGAIPATSSHELAQAIRAGGAKNLKRIRAQAAAESFQAPVDMPPLTKEQWYEILQVTQRAAVREYDGLHSGTINLHPAVRERAEHSVSVMTDVCSIIVKGLPELEGNLTESYKAVRAKAATTAPKRT